MITSVNLKEVLSQLPKIEIETVLDSPYDYILLWVNGYGSVNLQSVNPYFYDEAEQIANDTGGILCDKDTFLGLWTEE
jgi:hypothetical protein